MNVRGVWFLKKYLLIPVLISSLVACSDGTQQAADRPQGNVAPDAQTQEAGAQNNDESLVDSPGAGVEEPVMPSDGPAPEDSPVPSVSDPNVPVLPDQRLGRADQSEPDTQPGPEPLDTVPVTGMVPGSSTLVTPDVDVSDEAPTEATASTEGER